VPPELPDTYAALQTTREPTRRAGGLGGAPARPAQRGSLRVGAGKFVKPCRVLVVRGCPGRGQRAR